MERIMGFAGKRFLFFPSSPHSILNLLSPQLSRNNSIGNACYAGLILLVCLNRRRFQLLFRKLEFFFFFFFFLFFFLPFAHKKMKKISASETSRAVVGEGCFFFFFFCPPPISFSLHLNIPLARHAISSSY